MFSCHSCWSDKSSVVEIGWVSSIPKQVGASWNVAITVRVRIPTIYIPNIGPNTITTLSNFITSQNVSNKTFKLSSNQHTRFYYKITTEFHFEEYEYKLTSTQILTQRLPDLCSSTSSYANDDDEEGYFLGVSLHSLTTFVGVNSLKLRIETSRRSHKPQPHRQRPYIKTPCLKPILDWFSLHFCPLNIIKFSPPFAPNGEQARPFITDTGFFVVVTTVGWWLFGHCVGSNNQMRLRVLFLEPSSFVCSFSMLMHSKLRPDFHPLE